MSTLHTLLCWQVIKHVYAGHVVLQLDCTNTLNDQLLEKVSIEMEPPEGWQLVGSPQLISSRLSRLVPNFWIRVALWVSGFHGKAF